MRPVHDILNDRRPDTAPGPCAFIQHGSDPYEYECVCPFCALTVGERIHSDTSFSYGWLITELKKLMKAHMPFCTADGRTLRVYRTEVPLGTSEAPKVM
jgi:hypothetical protein